MPELPEVETIACKLKAHIVGKRVTNLSVLHPKSMKGDFRQLIGKQIIGISRKAKIIRLHFPEQINILIHLKMTGQLIYTDSETHIGGGHPTADWVSELPSKHTRIMVHLSDDDATLFFNDQRLFGWWKVMDDSQVEVEFEKLGLDIIDPLFTAKKLYDAFQKTARPVKVVLMDGAKVSGVGNIYACDALNLAQIDPWRPARSLSEQEAECLYDAARTVIWRGIELGGATIDHYRNIEGFAGQYQNAVLVYSREGLPCYNCGVSLAKVKLAGRGTY
ncbi:bifunctional DNA-formamidopyrimidine glycosylase/DNA-(apurinic or apyrimidinic site) lyase, partial [Candidatus Woesebacteria bacterium]|nr:bifunctional DNA-formamidopyrimidine glycosylase/DNA-(apurinic or apyrimidinic site) lyase [Candidatus Woesebacteria bacterium]